MTSRSEAKQPKRIQRRRMKGWRMPEGAVYVGRPTIFGNDYVVGVDQWWGEPADAADVVEMFHHDMDKFQTFHPDEFEAWIAHLRGHDLACWCALDAPCHADVLLELANAPQNVESNGSSKNLSTEGMVE